MKRISARWARWGWLTTTFLMGAALLTTAWLGRARAMAAAVTLNRGQSELLLEAVRLGMRNTPEPLSAAHLDSVRNAHAGTGLRYLAIRDSDAALLVESGVPAAGGPVPGPIEPGPPTIETIGSRVRVTAPMRISRAAEPPPGPPVGPRGHPPMLILEFEPLLAEGLVAEAARRFVLSALVAATLLVAALAFWRLTILHEATERRVEQQRRLSVLGGMSAVLAHEIRNPLASLKGHAQLLAERLPAGTQERDKADLVVREAQRLETLTTDLLDFARSGPIERQPTDPVALVRACVEDVDPEGFTLRVEGAPTEWPLDERRMRRALTNVLRNARQAAPARSRAEITVAARDGALVIAVRDFGPGIAADDIQRIFDPFVTTRTTGTGLGLAVAGRIVETHGGTITAANHPGGGAVFDIEIPLAVGA
jgi:two-component system sensor histidine kinase HydH